MNKDKYHANKGVRRNKKPLQNIIYRVELIDPRVVSFQSETDFTPYAFKDLGYLYLYWGYEKTDIRAKRLHGYITPDKLKSLLGDKQWQKFCQGKRDFIIQRRVDGHNI